MEFWLIILIPFALALLAPAAARRLSSAQQGAVMAAVMAALFAALLTRLPVIGAGETVAVSMPWMPQIGLALSLYIDGLALLFALLVTGMGAAILFYAGYYFEDGREAGRFLALLLAFTGSMLGLVLAGNLLTLFIAWEGTSILSYLLISFKGKDPEARRGASQALMITGGGGLALLVGLLLLGGANGSMEFTTLLTSGDALREHAWYPAALILILIGCFSKSAQFPLHFWLPGAMSAPTPASAFLHSATMVKAGVYLLARLSPVLGDTALWTILLTTFGLVTLFVGAALALPQRDLKGILAYSTISQLGSMVALIGLPESEGMKAALVGVLAHALYKGTLFLVAGAVDHATGTRDVARLGGLRPHLPGFALVTIVVGLSMAGVPPLFGFVSKETLLEAFITQPIALAVIVVSAAFMVVLALRLYLEVFAGAEPEELHFHALPRPMVAGPALLAGLSIIAGVGVGPLITPLVQPAIEKPISLYLLPPGGVNLALMLSVTALALGVGVYALRRSWQTWTLSALPSGTQVYTSIVGAVESFGDTLLRSQNGKIRYYLATILLSVALLLATAIVRIDADLFNLPVVFTGAADVLKMVLLALALVATLASIAFRRHLLAALSLGVGGYAVGGIFLLEPAPDVALVQFLVETLATVLIVVILGRTSAEERERVMSRLWGQTRRGLRRDILISVAMGVAVTVFALAAVGSRPTPAPIAAWHLDNAEPEVGVTDVVAAIVTDFRGTDTLIEITVFGMAALGVLTLLARPNPGRTMRLFWRQRRAGASADAVEPPVEVELPLLYRSRFSNPVTQLAALLILPFAILIALAHILYAGVAPGDGFTAGVILGLGVGAWYVVYGYEETKQRLRWLHPAPIIGIGLCIAYGNALLPVLFGREFLAFTELTGIDFANIKLASTTLYEVGICLAVFGGVSTIMDAISHPRECEPL